MHHDGGLYEGVNLYDMHEDACACMPPDCMVHVGVPPHIMLNEDVRQLKKNIENLNEQFKSLQEEAPANIAAKVKDVLLENFEGLGPAAVTKTEVLEMMKGVQDAILDKIGDLQVGSGGSGNAPTPEPTPQYQFPGGTIGQNGWRLFTWSNGEIHPVPRGWNISIMTTSNLFNLWLNGDHHEKILPYHLLKACDFSSIKPNEDAAGKETKKMRDYYYKAKRVMNKIVEGMGCTLVEAKAKRAIDREEIFRESFIRMLSEAYPGMTAAEMDQKRFGDRTWMRMYDIIQPSEKEKAKRQRRR